MITDVLDYVPSESNYSFSQILRHIFWNLMAFSPSFKHKNQFSNYFHKTFDSSKKKHTHTKMHEKLKTTQYF